MRRKDRNEVSIRVSLWRKVAGFLLLCIMLGGCGVQDKALTIPFAVSAGDSAGEEEDGGGSYNGEAPGVSGNALPEREERICVYVCGAVEAPGVVELPSGSRAADALEAAGGFAEEARTDYVNLAAKLSDGEKLYFPTREEAEEMESQAREAADGRVNINTADEALLATLPGIGEAKARDIIAYREAKGGFGDCEELMQVDGIKESTYGKLQDKIKVE